MDLIIAATGFIFLSIIWTYLLFGTMKKIYNIKRKSMILILFFFMALALILLVVGAVTEYMESPEFCGTACHPRAGIVVDDTPMGPYYDSYTSPGNNEIMAVHSEEEVTCSNCHDKPGITGKIKAYGSAVVEVLNYVTGNYDADHLETHYSNENCLKCHDGEVASVPDSVPGLNNISVDPHDDEERCNSCHSPHQTGIGLTAIACSSCHEVSREEIDLHGKRAGVDCMSCHDRQHPGDAMLSFSSYPDLIKDSFCGDCHSEVYLNYSSWPEPRLARYGNCTTMCHTEHKPSEVPHTLIGDNESNCNECHTYAIEAHKPDDIIFYNFTGVIDNDFCGGCHEDEYEVYEEWYDDKKMIYGTCTSLCHKEHNREAVPHLTTAPYNNNCNNCHIIGTETHVQKDAGYTNVGYQIENEFCESCHKAQVESLSQGIHDSQDCTNCHSEHEGISTAFDNCRTCHTAIPTNHDEFTSSCGICHKVEIIH